MAGRLFDNLPASLADLTLGEGPRRKVLEGTARLVVRRSFAELTVQDLLDEAGIARRTFYKIYRSKEDALRDLFEVGSGLMLAVIEAAASAASDPVLRISRGIEAFLDVQVQGAKLVVALTDEARRNGSLLAPRREELLRRLGALVEREYAELTGERVEPTLVRALLLGVEGLVIETHREGPLSSADRARLQAVLLPMVLRTLAPPGIELPALPLREEGGSA